MNELLSDELPTPCVFLDFDGTITRRDATDAILETFARPEWRRIEEAWAEGRIGSRACLAAQMDLVAATRDEVDGLLDTIDVDPGFAGLLETCAAHRLPVFIVSDGFDYCIHRILSRPSLNLAAHLAGMPIVSSHLEERDGHWHAGFRSDGASCEHGCATCKPAVMRALNPAGRLSVFVGDGRSDRFAAACADVLFAKDALAVYCEAHAIPYRPYDTLATVAGHLDRLARSEGTYSPA